MHILREDLQGALQGSKTSLSRRFADTSNGYVLVESRPSAGVVLVAANNFETSIEYRLPLQDSGEESERVLIPAGPTLAFLGKCSAEVCRIASRPGKTWMKCGHSTVGFPTPSPSDWKGNDNAHDPVCSARLNKVNFDRTIRTAIVACNPLSPVSTKAGVTFSLEGDELWLYTISNHSFFCKLSGGVDGHGDCAVVVPKATCARLNSSIRNGSEVDLHLEETGLVLSGERTRLRCHSLQYNRVPSIRSIVSKFNSLATVHVYPSDLAMACQRVSTVVSKESTCTAFTINGDVIELERKGSTGLCRDQVQCCKADSDEKQGLWLDPMVVSSFLKTVPTDQQVAVTLVEHRGVKGLCIGLPTDPDWLITVSGMEAPR